MTVLGLSIMWWAVLCLALLVIAWVSALDRAEQDRRDRAQSIPAASSLPLAVSIPTAYRRKRARR